MSELSAEVVSTIRDIPDFPRPGVLFKDITPVLSDAGLFSKVLHWFAEEARPWRPNKVVCIESRGFILGSSLVTSLGAGLVPARKSGKLPYETVSQKYDLEYGSAVLEMHVDGIVPGDRVVIVDDLLATGGTASAAASLIRRLGGEPVGALFLIELEFLKGRNKVSQVAPGMEHRSLVVY